jgi:DNA-binding LytR/AlgR family response regulator
MQMWIGICEDTAEDRIKLESEVRNLAHPCDRVTVYANGFELLDDIYTAVYPMDMLLLDIEMPGLSGIDTALELQKSSPGTQIIVTTRFKEYALKCYAIRPSNYLLKPIQIKALAAEIDRARRIAGDDIGEALPIKAKDTVAFVPLKDILYIECFGRTLHVHTKTATFKYIHKFGQVCESLADNGFICIHKSFLINQRHLERIDRTLRTAVMVTGKALPISELRITDVLAAYSRFRQSTLPSNTAPAYAEADYTDHSVSRSLAGTFG